MYLAKNNRYRSVILIISRSCKILNMATNNVKKVAEGRRMTFKKNLIISQHTSVSKLFLEGRYATIVTLTGIGQGQQPFFSQLFGIASGARHCWRTCLGPTSIVIENGQPGLDKTFMIQRQPRRSFGFVKNLQFRPDNTITNLQPLLLLASHGGRWFNHPCPGLLFHHSFNEALDFLRPR